MGSIFSIYSRRKYVVPSSFGGEDHVRLETNPELNNSCEAVLMAVSRDPHEIQFASPEMRNDATTIYKVVKQNGSLLCYASRQLRDNHTIVRTAIMNGPTGVVSPFAFASKRLKADFNMCQLAHRYNETAENYFSPEILSMLDKMDKKEKKHISWEEQSFA